MKCTLHGKILVYSSNFFLLTWRTRTKIVTTFIHFLQFFFGFVVAFNVVHTNTAHYTKNTHTMHVDRVAILKEEKNKQKKNVIQARIWCRSLVKRFLFQRINSIDNDDNDEKNCNIRKRLQKINEYSDYFGSKRATDRKKGRRTK